MVFVGFNELAHKILPPQTKILEKLNEVKLVAVGRKGNFLQNKGKTNPTLLKTILMDLQNEAVQPGKP